jgi:hypothetical protein
MQIGRTHAERQRFALAQVLADRDPFGGSPPGVDPPFDTHGYAEVLNRKAPNAGMPDAVADSFFFTPWVHWPEDEVLPRLEADLKRIVAACRSEARREHTRERVVRALEGDGKGICRYEIPSVPSASTVSARGSASGTASNLSNSAGATPSPLAMRQMLSRLTFRSPRSMLPK